MTLRQYILTLLILLILLTVITFFPNLFIYAITHIDLILKIILVGVWIFIAAGYVWYLYKSHKSDSEK